MYICGGAHLAGRDRMARLLRLLRDRRHLHTWQESSTARATLIDKSKAPHAPSCLTRVEHCTRHVAWNEYSTARATSFSTRLRFTFCFSAHELLCDRCCTRVAVHEMVRGGRKDLIRTSICDRSLGLMQITPHLDRIGHCKTTSGANWSKR